MYNKNAPEELELRHDPVLDHEVSGSVRGPLRESTQRARVEVSATEETRGE